MTMKNLTGKEKHARLFAIFLALMCSDCSGELTKKTMKGYPKERPYGKNMLQKWLFLIEDTLIIIK